MVEVLMLCSSESCKAAPRIDPHPPPPDDKGEMQVMSDSNVSVIFSNFSVIFRDFFVPVNFQ